MLPVVCARDLDYVHDMGTRSPLHDGLRHFSKSTSARELNQFLLFYTNSLNSREPRGPQKLHIFEEICKTYTVSHIWENKPCKIA
jgi:hypothetical protein